MPIGKRKKQAKQKGTAIHRPYDKGHVPKAMYIEERLRRIKAEDRAKYKHELDDGDINQLLRDLSDDSSSSSSDSDSDHHDSSSSSSSSDSDDSLRSLSKQIKKLKTKEAEKRRELEEAWLTEAQKETNKRWKKKALYVDQELYTRHKEMKREIHDVGGPTAWIQQLFKTVNSGMKVTENLVWKMVSRFAVVMFVKEVNKEAGKASQIIDRVREKHNITEDEVLEVVLDDSHAAKVTFIDLQRLTNKRNFPQIFVNETFIGGLTEIKDFAEKGLLLRQILIFQGIVDSKCEKCVKLEDHRKLAYSSKSYDH